MKEIRKIKVKPAEKNPNSANNEGNELPNIPTARYLNCNRPNPFYYNPVDFYASHLRMGGVKATDTGLCVLNPNGKIFRECVQFPSAVYLKQTSAPTSAFAIQPVCGYIDLLFNDQCVPKANLISVYKFEEIYKVYAYLATKYSIIDTIRRCQSRSNPMFKEIKHAYMTINKVIRCCADILEIHGYEKLCDICNSRVYADKIVALSKMMPFDILDVYDEFAADVENSDEEE